MIKSELRKDYLLDRWVIISEKRSRRPFQFEEPKIKEKICYFCPGNEHLTTKEISRVEEKGTWKIRVIQNKFPALRKGNPKIKKRKYYTYGDAFGKQEIIIETRAHNKQLADLDILDIKEVLDMYKLRIKDLSKIKGIKYVQIIKNHGFYAGTSIAHSHSQVLAYNKIPFWVKKEIEANKRKCHYCDIIKKEMKSQRKVYNGKYFIAFCPFASRTPYELWFFPKRHIKEIYQLNNKELFELAKLLKRALLKLNENNFSYNYYIHYSPEEDLHFHIELLPRAGILGGFEMATNTFINTVSPETASKFYRK